MPHVNIPSINCPHIFWGLLYFMDTTPTAESSTQQTPRQSSSFFSVRNKNKNLQQFLKKPFFISVLIAVLLIIGILVVTLRSVGDSKPVLGDNDPRVAIAPVKATQKIGKTFSFPLRDDKGAEVSKIRYTIESAELRDELIINGQRNVAVKGRQFLVLNIKFSNDFDKAIEITTRDYVRLIINNSSEKIAADIHNDPIQVQPISTKTTRLAFPIDDKKQSLKIQVGEINGKKETIQLKLDR